MPPWLAPNVKILADLATLLITQDNLFLLLYLSIKEKHKEIRVLEYFFLFTALLCFDSIFTLLKRIADGSFYAKREFFFLCFL